MIRKKNTCGKSSNNKMSKFEKMTINNNYHNNIISYHKNNKKI